MDEFAIHIILWLLGSVIKNPGKKQALKSELLKIRDTISSLYPNE